MRYINFVNCLMLTSSVLASTYSKKLSTMNKTETIAIEPTVINVSLSIESVHFVDVKKMELQVRLFLHQEWIDSRLGVNGETRRKAVMGQIWKPKLTLSNGMVLNKENGDDFTFWRGFGTKGKVLLSEKITLNVLCTMDLRYFPFDRQICELKFGSYRFPIEEVILNWSGKSLQVLNGVRLNEFHLQNITTCAIIEDRPSGKFSVLTVELNLKRYFLHYIICVGIPSTLIVIISYSILFIKKEDSSVKCALNIFCLASVFIIYVFSMCTQLVTFYLKAIELYNILNIIFVFLGTMRMIVVDFSVVSGNEFRKSRRFIKSIIWLERCFKIGYLLVYLSCIILYLVLIYLI